MRKLLVALLALASLAPDAHAIRKRRGLNHGASFVYDFTNGVPSTVTCARASGTVYPMLTATTTTTNTSGSTCVYENRTGAANDGMIWTWDAWSNARSTPNVFTTGYTISGSGAVTDNAATSPDGTSDAAKTHKNQGTTFFANTINISKGQPVALSFWMKNDITPATQGMNYWNGTGAVDNGCKTISDPPPTPWTRQMYWIGTMADTSSASLAPLAFAPAGLVCGPSFTNTSQGAIDYWGVQLATQVDYPLGAGSIAAQKLQLNSGELPRIVIGGDIELDVFARTWIQELRAQPDGCLIGGTGSDGEFSLCYSAGVNSASAATWTLKVAGSTVLTTQMGLPLYGGELRARISCRPSTNTSVLRISINGATMYTRIATGTCNGGTPLNALTSLYLGSNNGSASYWPVGITKLVSYARPQAYNRDEIVWLGDSISSWTYDTDALGARLDNVVITGGALGVASGIGNATAQGTLATGGLYTLAQSRQLNTHPGIAAVVHPGALCEDIETDYTATPYYGSGFTHAIIIECLTNNINPSGGNQSVATATSKYQHLVNTAHTANPSAPIICVQITPWSAQKTKVNAVNDCINGGGGGQCAANSGSVITGCTYVVTHANSVLDDGAGACLYCTDGIHPTNHGRQLMTDGTGAGTFIGSLTSAGILP